MKTAISVPDDTFRRVEAASDRLGVSRSRFFTDAAEAYLKSIDRHDLTARINAALLLRAETEVTEDAALTAASTALFARHLDAEPW